MTILHHAASSSSDNAVAFAQALLEHPLTDVYIQDAENGWTGRSMDYYAVGASLTELQHFIAASILATLLLRV
jgi:hypothetical protein